MMHGIGQESSFFNGHLTRIVRARVTV